MYPNDFTYAAPATLDEAIALLQSNADAKILAGGHSLLPLMKMRLLSPPMLIDVGNIAELRRISANGDLQIGATATYTEVERSDEVRRHSPIISAAVRNIGDAQVRNRGTIGGAIAHADPASDMTAVILALGGTLKARGPNGERAIPVDDFFVDMLETQLASDEILTTISIPPSAGRPVMAYEKFKHPASGYAIVGVAVVMGLDDEGKISSCRIGVTGAGPKPQRARKTEGMLVGQPPTTQMITAAAEQAASGLEFLSDLAASEEFRAHLVRVHTRRALEKALAIN